MIREEEPACLLSVSCTAGLLSSSTVGMPFSDSLDICSISIRIDQRRTRLGRNRTDMDSDGLLVSP